MKLTSIFVLTIGLNLSLSSQSNFIPNSSFEEISSCPDNKLSLQKIELCKPWFNAVNSYHYSSIFNTCFGSISPNGVPLNHINRYNPIFPRTGNGYAGFINFTSFSDLTNTFIEVPLVDGLKNNFLYYIEFYVYPAKRFSEFSSAFSDAFALAFSDTLYINKEESNFGFIPNFKPAIENTIGNIIIDSTKWSKISGLYYSKGSEKFVILGNFKPNSETNAVTNPPTAGTATFYFIDDVGVFEFGPSKEFLTICKNQNLRLGKQFLDAKYKWNTGETDSIITVTKAGTYIFNAILDNVKLSDTITVVDEFTTLSYLLPDTTLCKNEVLNINLPIVGSYEWSSGEKTNSIQIKSPKTYSVTITTNCSQLTQIFEVKTEECNCNVYIPSAFSPNNDGINDFLECFVGCKFDFRPLRFQIFDRWGSLVFQTASSNLQDLKWDGTFGNKPLGTGIFIYSFEYEFTRNGKIKKQIVSGEFSLIR